MAARVAHPLPAFGSGISAAANVTNARPMSLQLARGEVYRVDRSDGVREIQVLDGVLWLTATPADGDLLLRAADRFSPAASWPIVFEALKDASVRLLR
ncbi:MAG: hypothetical protein ABJF10_25345 [Chthoniobacter sp.]